MEPQLTPLERDIAAARHVSTPLIAIKTPDVADVQARLMPILSSRDGVETPVVVWDLVQGARVGVKTPASEKGLAVLRSVAGGEEMLNSPLSLLQAALSLPENSVLILHNFQMVLPNDVNLRQAVCNLRDPFKSRGCSLVMLGRTLRLTPELEGDVMVYVDPLPDRNRRKAIISSLFNDAEVPLPADDHMERAIDAVTGISPFAVDQVASLAITPSSIDIPSLQERRVTIINETPGLSVLQGPEKFENIGGCGNIKEFFRRVIGGDDQPKGFVFLDEIEKMLGSSDTDLSGTSLDQMAQLLTFMQDRRSAGVILIGHPGTAKSQFAKAAGNEAGVLTIQLDLGGLKGSLVGQSEERMREALRVIDSVTEGHALWIATCNQISALKPELRRRFKFGTFFFDLPNDQERDLIWQIYLSKFGLTDTSRPMDHGWTGAEIETCCQLAKSLKCSLVEAASYIVPVSKSAPERIDNLCREAHNRFISAATPGVYEYGQSKSADLAAMPTGRKFGKH